MPSDQHGKILKKWNFPEFPIHHHTVMWATMIIVLGVAFATWAIVSGNYLLGFIIVAAGLIVGLREMQGPDELQVRICEDGIEIGRHMHFLMFQPATTFIPWNQLESFWMMYEPPRVKRLYVQYKSRLRPLLSISLEDENPLEVRDALSQYLEEEYERVDEPLTDALGRWMRL